jgi:molybdopterin-containing oxidoreductase family iron-sulfur binding subunit
VAACKEEKQTSPGVSLIRVEQVGPDGIFPYLNMYYLPVACQQCAAPACAAACPEDAIGRSDDGVIAIDTAKCTGCGECADACPYKAVALDVTANLARTCDLCAELLSKGRQPACAALCPGKAIQVIDLDEVRVAALPSEDRGRARTEHLVLRASAGTDPSGRFILSRQEWRDRC